MWGKWKNEGWMILFEMQDKRGYFHTRKWVEE